MQCDGKCGNVCIFFSYMNNTYYKGTIQYSNGNFYDGEFLNNKPHGKGTMQFTDGIVFFGNWQYGLPVKENGVVVLTDGNTIEDSVYNYHTSFLSNKATELKLSKIKPTEGQMRLEKNKSNHCPYGFREPTFQPTNLNNHSNSSSFSNLHTNASNTINTAQITTNITQNSINVKITLPPHTISR